MSTELDERPSRTRIQFDLEDVITPEELDQFRRAAEEAGVSPTDHFLNLTIRLNSAKAS